MSQSNPLNVSEESILKSFETLQFGDVHIKQCSESGMIAIIAIHNTVRGPSLGGLRLSRYPNFMSALQDVMYLARGMSYKAAISGLPHGGGKAVIIEPSIPYNREKLMQSFGSFVHELGGRYITAEDSGVFVSDMDIIRSKTPYVSGFTDPEYECEDPSPLTALGLLKGIEAAVKFKLDRNSLEGVHVAVHGVGKVGFNLCVELHNAGAKLTVADLNPNAIQYITDRLPVTIVEAHQIHKVSCDVYSPCALSFALTNESIQEIQAPIIAGAANNQLESNSIGLKLWEQGVLYAPDFAINAGGLIQVAAQYGRTSESEARKRVESIYDTMFHIFERSEQLKKAPYLVALDIAESRLTLTATD